MEQKRMKAVVYTEYGAPEVLRLTEMSIPVPKEREILVKIHAATVAAGDCRMRKPDPFAARFYNGLFRPKRVNILGFECSGCVEAIGDAVDEFKPGDEVFAFTGFGFGAYAQYICLPVENRNIANGFVTFKPATVSHAEAAAVPCGGLTALGFLNKAGIRNGQKILVYGASGSVGTYAVQLAGFFGAEVTGVCSTANLELVASLGAQRVVDYTTNDLAGMRKSFDIVFDAVGKLSPVDGKSLARKNGVYLSVNGSSEPMIEDLDFLRKLIEAGILKAVIDRRYPLEQIVEAHQYVDRGHKRGNVVITVC